MEDQNNLISLFSPWLLGLKSHHCHGYSWDDPGMEIFWSCSTSWGSSLWHVSLRILRCWAAYSPHLLLVPSHWCTELVQPFLSLHCMCGRTWCLGSSWCGTMLHCGHVVHVSTRLVTWGSCLAIETGMTGVAVESRNVNTNPDRAHGLCGHMHCWTSGNWLLPELKQNRKSF